jgi:hypothetical protein
MSHVKRILLSAMLFGLLFPQVGCQPFFKRRAPVQDYKVKIISDAKFVRTRHGEYLDGYLVEYELRFEKKWMFIVLDIQKYLKGDRLIVSGRFTDEYVRMSPNNQIDADISVFHVQRAAPVVSWGPDPQRLK